MNCATAHQHMCEGLDGRLAYFTGSDLRLHLRGCSACATEFAEYKALQRALGDLANVTLTTPAGFAARVVDEALRDRQAATERWPLSRLAGRCCGEAAGATDEGRRVAVRVVGWGLAAVAVAIGLQYHHGRRGRPLKTS